MGNIGILGGGLTGLALGYFLEGKNEILEREAVCGGLCRSIRKNGFLYDQGGHIIFSKDKAILKFIVDILGSNAGSHYRNSKVWYKGSFIKYPFENGLADLPKEDLFECLYHYINNTYRKPKNFKEWIYYTFGKGIAEKYLIPYNEKIWKEHAELMGIEWVERIPRPPLEDVLKAAIGIKTEGYTHQLNYYYPKQGGIQALIESLEGARAQASIIRGFAVKSLKKRHSAWIVSNGKEEREYKRVVSTIPIFDLIGALSRVPDKVQKTVQKLKYNSLMVVMLGVKRPNLSDKTAVYIPDSKILPHRLCFSSSFGDDWAPRGMSSLIAEVTAREASKLWKTSDAVILEKVIGSLHGERFIDKKEITQMDLFRAKYAYVIYDLEYCRNMKVLYEYFKELGIDICGRFAEFKYLNMDACVRNAKDLAFSINKAASKK